MHLNSNGTVALPAAYFDDPCLAFPCLNFDVDPLAVGSTFVWELSNFFMCFLMHFWSSFCPSGRSFRFTAPFLLISISTWWWITSIGVHMVCHTGCCLPQNPQVHDTCADRESGGQGCHSYPWRRHRHVSAWNDESVMPLIWRELTTWLSVSLAWKT